MTAIALALLAFAQLPATNYDESKVPAYTLPDLLKTQAGAPVSKAAQWPARRAEIFALLEAQMFGRAPQAKPKVAFELTELDKAALGGKAVRKQITIHLAGHKIPLLVYLPAGAKGKVPVFLGLNFNGNHAVTADPGVLLPTLWRGERETRLYTPRPATEASRGGEATRWQLDMILARGYGLATIYYGSVEPDFSAGYEHGIRPLLSKPADDGWGAIGAWAYALSRALDYLETDPQVDAKRVAVIGHSRLGKTSLWAGASDPRFALVISNNSGEGGAAISRRIFGETVAVLNKNFPHWFCPNYRQYSGREPEMPFDSHMLLALVAPRPLYVASAEEDQWADPKGEFLAALAVSPVYALFGKRGVGVTEMPALNTPVGDTVGYHYRTGKHDVTAYDWQRYLDFADKHLKSRP